MALFQSSWDTRTGTAALSSISSSKLTDKPKSNGKKRKSEDGGMVGPSIDLDSLMKKMAGVGTGKDAKGKGNEREGKKKVEGKDGEGKKAKVDGEGGKVKTRKEKPTTKNAKGKPEAAEPASKPPSPTKPISTSTPFIHTSPDSKPRGEKRKGDEDAARKSKKQKKRELRQTEETQSSVGGSKKEKVEAGTGVGALTALQSSMKSTLEGARFRFINEQLYKSSSDEAQELMRQDPQVYAEYHTGFRHQTKSWPQNPVKLIASSLSSLPPRSLIADLGCGDAELAKTLVPSGLNVLSFDLVSDNAWVVQADICTRLPLPGSEKGEGEQAVVDACVCSLSLMSTNWVGCAREAWRVLRPGGRFVVAEVTSRFRDTEAFTKLLSELGFELIEQTAPSTHFLLFEFRKVERDEDLMEQEWERIRESADTLLKPCEYKRR